MCNNDWKINAAIPQSSKWPDLARPLLVGLLAVVGSLGAGARAQAQSRDDYCGSGLPPGFEAAPERELGGRYVNATYGYSVSIPARLTAFVSASGPERGFVIALSRSPRAYLHVDAGYDAFYDITPAGVYRRDLNTVRLHDAVTDEQMQPARLSEIEGLRATMRLRCRGSEDEAVHEEVIVVRGREIYRLDLQTVPDRLAQDRRQLDAMIRSWRWVAVNP